jgi:hypothetical protein
MTPPKRNKKHKIKYHTKKSDTLKSVIFNANYSRNQNHSEGDDWPANNI